MSKKQHIILLIVIIIAFIIIIAIYLQGNNKLYEYILYFNNMIHAFRDENLGNFQRGYDNYLQFVPIIILFILKLGGVKGRMKWKNFWLFFLLSIALTQIVVFLIKITALEIRPDSSDFLSFPSGHTATAFMSATVLFTDYNKRSKWISVIGYSCALSVAGLRILNDRHWLFDVIIGAILGIVLTYAAYLIIIYFSRRREP